MKNWIYLNITHTPNPFFLFKKKEMFDPVHAFYSQARGSYAATAYSTRELPRTDLENLFEKLMDGFGPVATTLNAFNHWILNILPQQIMEKAASNSTSVYSFKNVKLFKPAFPNGDPIFPYRARKDGLTYTGKLVATVTRRPISALSEAIRAASETGGPPTDEVLPDEDEGDEYEIGQIPILVGSIACNLSGYSAEDRKLVFESENDLGGYFIIRGGERVNVNQENLAFSQQFTKVTDMHSLETRVTTQATSGSTVVAIASGNKWPTVKIVIYRSGLKGTTVQCFPIFTVADMLLQQSEPEIYKYESVDSASSTAAARRVEVEIVSAEERQRRRKAVLEKTINLIKMFVPAEKWALIQRSLIPSIVKYSYITNPIRYVVQKKVRGSTINAVAGAAALSASKRAASAAATGTGSESAMSAAVDAADTAASGAAAAGAERRTVLIIQELMSSFFSTVPDGEGKLNSLARIVAQHLLCTTGSRKEDDPNSWDGRRIKLSSDNMAQILNGNFRVLLTTNGRRSKFSADPGLTDTFVSAFGSAGPKGRDNVVDAAKRDTPIALISQIGRIDARAVRQSKNIKLRVVQPTQLGIICPAETPCSDACGITKNLACTAGASLRRDIPSYIREVLNPALKNTVNHVVTKDQRLRPHVILLDNVIKGWCDMRVLGAELRRLTKRNPRFFDVGIIENPDDQALEIYATGSRPIRPLLTIDPEAPGGLVINNLPPGITINSPIMKLVEAGAIEFVHAREQSRFRVSQFVEEIPNILQIRRNTFDEWKRVQAKKKGLPEEAGASIGKHLQIDYDSPTPPVFLPLYSELDPLALFGIAAGLMPYQNTCQGPRVTYQAGMSTQALGNYHSTYYERWDTSYKRTEGERPTLETRIAASVGANRMPTGRMYIVAITALANNAEDGIVFQKESLEHHRVVRYGTHKIIAKPPIESSTRNAPSSLSGGEKIMRPGEADTAEARGTRRQTLYHAIGPDGLPRLGARIGKGDCIVGKVRMSTSHSGAETVSNASVFAGVGDEGVVDRVDLTTTGTGAVIARVKIRQSRPVFVGDKVSSRYSQKGTIAAFRSDLGVVGAREISDEAIFDANVDPSELREAVAGYASLTPEEAENELLTTSFARDLPRIATGPFAGVVPDCFINPHGQPSRMTVGMLMEMLGSKAALFTGERLDGTAFRQPSREVIETWREILRANGADPDGNETMVHSDGSPFRNGVKVFVGPCFYQSLRHTVTDKIQYRPEGNVMPMTHQPVHGRSREGGLRLGEMEKTALCGWGATAMIIDRLMLASDKYSFDVCATCGNQAYTNHMLKIQVCRVCPPQRTSIGVLDTPFISILINRMLAGIGIQTTYRFSKNRITSGPNTLAIAPPPLKS